MFLPDIKPRKFTFTPYYYVKEEVQDEEEGQHGIKFRRIRRRSPRVKKPINRLVLLTIFVIFALYYFLKLVDEQKRTFKIEDIRIEEAPE